MTPSRREFLKSVGIAIGSLMAARCIPAVPTQPSATSTLPDPDTPTLNCHSFVHCHVSVESFVIVKVTVFVEPPAGTLPVPVHPVHTHRSPFVSSAGEVTELVMTVPSV